jgi:beta-mannosidase
MKNIQKLTLLFAAALGLAIPVCSAQQEGVQWPAVPLDGDWQLSYGDQRPDGPRTPAELAQAHWPTIAATVPGNVELDLMQAGKLPDLSIGNNIYRLRELEGDQWWYQRKFNTPRLPRNARVELVFDGLDCLGTIFLNGRLVGEAHNMFIAHRFDVTDLLRAEGAENELAVRLDSAVLAGRQHQPAAVEGAFQMSWESLAIRKAPHMYGWDIMPRIVSAGLWRSVRLEFVPPTRSLCRPRTGPMSILQP